MRRRGCEPRCRSVTSPEAGLRSATDGTTDDGGNGCARMVADVGDENGDGKLSFGGKFCHSSFDCCVANGRRWQQNSTTCVWRTACSSGS